MDAGGDRGSDLDDLIRPLSEFAQTLTRRHDLTDVLYRLAEQLVDMLGAAGCGVSLVDPHGRLRRATGINELTDRLEAVEEQFQEGPCVDAFRLGIVVAIPKLDDVADHWPRWSAQAAERGVHAVLGVPLRAGDKSIGAINIYAANPRRWATPEIRAVRALADMAASYIANITDLEESRRRTEQLQQALHSRVIIEQAKGVLASELRTSIDQAFLILRNHARRNNTSLRSIAHAVVELGLRLPRDPTKSP